MGASAGGLEAFQRFFANMPSNAGIAFVIVQHLDPDHQSMMTQLLARSTGMKVVEAEDGMRIDPDHVYIIPPNRFLAVDDGALRLTAPLEPRGLRMPVDFLFRSLGESQKEHSICVVLSGSGNDGSAALRAVNAAGGITIVQEPATAKYDGMPRSAIESGYADYVLPPERMPEQLQAYVKTFHKVQLRKTPLLPDRSGILSKILRLLRARTGHDFSLYKKSTIHRRIERRMSLHNISDLATYYRHLEERPEEAEKLFKEMLIRVTSFFRDQEAFGVLKAKVLPILLGDKKEGYGVRMWVPGCATGEEVYSIAIVIQEYMEEQKRDFSVQIFGTDIDEEAISIARTGMYPPAIAADMTPSRLKRFFKEDNGRLRISKEIREHVVFALQDVAKDPPFTRLDLISCRNLLIYLEAELQNRILPFFHYGLKPGGILLLGTSETIGQFPDLFVPLDKKWRFFQAKPSTISERATGLPEFAGTARRGSREDAIEVRKARPTNPATLAQNTLLERFAPPSVMVDSKGDILYFYGDTAEYLKPPQGQPVLNLFEMAREGLRHELAASLRTALSGKREVVREHVKVKTNGGFEPVTLIIRPISQRESNQDFFMVIFEAIRPAAKTDAGKRPAKKGRTSAEVDELQLELTYTRESLQATIEELQASNEELKSTNEEMQSTNEEMQSANEEMETGKEELQSVNEELITVNTELHAKIEQLSQIETVMKNLLENTNVGTVFLDTQMNIVRFTAEATKVINLIPSDVGRPLAHTVSNLLYDGLVTDARQVLQDLSFKEMDVRSRDGNWYLVKVMPYRAPDQTVEGIVITFTDITVVRRLSQEQASREYAESIVDAVREPLIVLEASLRVVSANESFRRTFEVSREETEHQYFYELGNGQWNIPELTTLLENVVRENRTFQDFRIEHNFPSIGTRVMLINAKGIVREGKPSYILLAIEDVTDRRP